MRAAEHRDVVPRRVTSGAARGGSSRARQKSGPEEGLRRQKGQRRRDCPAFERRRSEEHTSELQSHHDLVCRLLLEKKKLYFDSLLNNGDKGGFLYFMQLDTSDNAT